MVQNNCFCEEWTWGWKAGRKIVFYFKPFYIFKLFVFVYIYYFYNKNKIKTFYLSRSFCSPGERQTLSSEYILCSCIHILK